MKNKIVLLAVCFLIISKLTFSQLPVTSGGAGAPAGSGLNGANNKGLPATGLGCGGGGGSWWGGTGGSGKYGGGGGGAGGYFSVGNINWAGGEGGQGIILIAYYNGVTLMNVIPQISGTSSIVPAGITSAKIWAIGGGGGGGGATQSDGTSGGSGGAGGVVYITKSVAPGDNIIYSIGTGGLPGHGSINGTAGGTTSVTVGGSTIYAYGGGAGLYNSSANASGGGFSGGDGGANGGQGVGRTGDVGGGGGGAIGNVNGTANGNNGGNGSTAADVSGLFAVCALAANPTLPFITSFTPTSGLGGTVMTITGSGFTGISAVRIGGVAVSSFTVNSDTQITATVAAGSVSGSVSVTCEFTTVSLPIYLFITPPVPSITSFSPVSAQTGTEITINGSNLLGVSAVNFGNINASSITVVSNFVVKATVGSGASGSVNVNSSGGSGTLSGFTWISTTQASNVAFSSIQPTQMTINWTNGNALKRAVFVKQGSGAISNPVSNTTYNASTDWNSKGSQLGNSGYYCIYNGTGNSVTITNLPSASTFTVQVFEYNGNTGAEVYFTSNSANNPNSQSTPVVLPLHWVDFTGTYQGDKVQLEWITENELNVDKFTVQKSSDCLVWSDIGVVPYKSNVIPGYVYRFGFKPESGGEVFFRIKETDFDGKAFYSKVISVAVHEPGKFEINNPVNNGILNIKIHENGWLKLYSLSGQLCYKVYCLTGQRMINIGQQPAGVYILMINRNRYRVLIQ